jgi:hypothetical protein
MAELLSVCIGALAGVLGAVVVAVGLVGVVLDWLDFGER